MSMSGQQDNPNTSLESPGAGAARKPSRHVAQAGRRRRRSPKDGSIGRVVVVYMLVALGAFVLCGVGLAAAQRHAALQEAVRDAETTTTLLATRVLQPAMPSASSKLLDTDQRFDRVVRTQVLGAPITQLVVLDESGTVLYATKTGVVGQRVTLSANQQNALRAGSATASSDNGVDPTRLGGARTGQSLDASVGLRAPSGQELLVQTRQPYQVVWLTSRGVWLTLLPSVILALALLYLAKIGFAFRLTRGLYNVQEGREQLLVTAWPRPTGYAL